ncbi:MAG TPA: response regulator transcription factor [Saprospiraceae bacterium]|nr:response regulator transcription factor [Saprospiraceae bacterium]HRO07960.1 response regulator transcription factor [Saprospiraceae bacterium]HRP41455.1 response regulator transcription factor [Saprospiraceae bacterium]
MNKPTILVIDDEPQIRKLLEITLESNDYNVILAENGTSGIKATALNNPDLILLDLDLPDKNGHEVLSELRQWHNKSIIILSVINNENDIVHALDNGATDYINKPFRSAELLARIRLAIKSNNTSSNNQIITIGDLEIDLAAMTLKKNNELLKLTSTEYNLLTLFVKYEGRTLTHQFILKEIWGIPYQTETQYLRVFVGNLRKKIEDNPNQPKHLITVSGIGYRLQ